MEQNILKAISFFAGIRGFDMGAKMAGFETTYHADKWPAAKLLFDGNKNRTDIPPQHYLNASGVYQVADIRKSDFKSINRFLKTMGCRTIKKGELALLLSGSPCQGFTGASFYRYAYDPRNFLMFDQARMTRLFLPMTAIWEQVPGFKTYDMKSFRDEFAQEIKECEKYYNIATSELNAANYGASQDRPRIIFMLVRKDIGVPSFPAVQPVKPEQLASSLFPYATHYRFDGREYCTDNLLKTITRAKLELKVGGVWRISTMEERLKACHLEGLKTDIPDFKRGDLNLLTANMVQIPFSYRLTKHIREHILKA